MNADFLDAHDRHREDADFLFNGQRWANADHLYGVSSECGLKRLMLLFGMQLDPGTDRPERKPDQVHANGIWARFEAYRSGHVAGTDYALPQNNPFGDWHVSQRYAHQTHFDQARTQVHQAAAYAVQALIKKAQIQGLI